MKDRFDIIVIGGGPAGSSSALFLAKKGYRVALLDQARFPRDKVCGEFISPAADPILEELGILSSIERLSPVRLRGVSISSYNGEGFAVDYPVTQASGSPVTSLSLPRTVLDHVFLKEVRRFGVEVREEHKVHDFLFDEGRVTGVKGWDAAKTPFTLKARVVVDAGGRNCISLRRFQLKRKETGAGKIALAAHWRGASLPGAYCYMHISHPGYTGMAAVEKDKVNVVLVVDRNGLPGEGLNRFYQRVVLENKERGEFLGGGELVEPVRTVDSLAYSVAPLPCGGLVRVGDAMGFIDPFTGEGIYLSLRSAQIAAGVLSRALDRSDFSRAHLAGYEKLRYREFKKKFILSRILQQLIYRPSLCNQVVRTLARNPHLAETLVGVIGDILPARRVVSFQFLGRLLTRSLWAVKPPRPSSGSTSPRIQGPAAGTGPLPTASAGSAKDVP